MMKKIFKEKNIAVFSYGRTQSQRCPNKMLRDFGGTSVADILLSKFSEIGSNTFFAGHDPKFKKKCEEYGVAFVQRTLESVTVDEPQTTCLSFLNDVDYDYVLLVNGCLPFLKTETILKFLDDVAANGLKPSSAVFKRHNYFFNLEKKSLNFPSDLKNLNTKTVEPIYEFANALYFYNREYFLETGGYWDWNTLNLIELENTIELIDIDTEEDFYIAESIWKNQHNLN